MEKFLASQKASIEEFVKASQAADRQEKDRLLAQTTKLIQKLAKEGKDRQNELLECKTNLTNIEAMLRDRDVDVENYVAKLDRAKHAAETARETSKKNAEKLRKVKEEVKNLKGEVEKLKKEAAESSQEATKAKRSLEDFQELEEVIERVQKRRVV
jgi:chromosome segregation ATPase